MSPVSWEVVILIPKQDFNGNPLDLKTLQREFENLADSRKRYGPTEVSHGHGSWKETAEETMKPIVEPIWTMLLSLEKGECLLQSGFIAGLLKLKERMREHGQKAFGVMLKQVDGTRENMFFLEMCLTAKVHQHPSHANGPQETHYLARRLAQVLEATITGPKKFTRRDLKEGLTLNQVNAWLDYLGSAYSGCTAISKLSGGWILWIFSELDIAEAFPNKFLPEIPPSHISPTPGSAASADKDTESRPDNKKRVNSAKEDAPPRALRKKG